MRQWYAVQSKPRQEHMAEAQLARQGYNTYLPKIRHRKQRGGKWTQVVEPLFPRYLFIEVDPAEQSLAPVRSTVGVAALVRFGQVLRPVPAPVIDYLQQAEDGAQGERTDDSWPFQPGDAVQVLEGPFAGLPAVYQMPSAEDRAFLLLELLGRDNQVELPHADLAPV